MLKQVQKRNSYNSKESPAAILRKIKANTGEPQGVNILLKGRAGTRKTDMLRTCVAPVLVDCFDPGGNLHLRDEEEAGRIVVNRDWMQFNPTNPSTFTKWEQYFNSLRNHPDFFNSIGTFVLDSFSSLEQCIIAEILDKPYHQADKETVRQKRKYEFGNMEIYPMDIQHYGVYKSTVEQVIRWCLALPCNFVLICHTKRDEEQKMEVLDVSGSQKNGLPKLFTEIWDVTLDINGEPQIMTQGNKFNMARTQIGPTVFKKKGEKADFKYLLGKAGYPNEDLFIYTDEEEGELDD